MEPTFIRAPEGWTSNASHWELPFSVQARRGITKWVIVSIIKDEAMIFPADRFGQPLEFYELYCEKGENLDAEKVLSDYIASASIAEEENKEEA